MLFTTENKSNSLLFHSTIFTPIHFTTVLFLCFCTDTRASRDNIVSFFFQAIGPVAMKLMQGGAQRAIASANKKNK